jgi:hypothetical protein
MGPLAAVQLVGSLVAAAVDVHEEPSHTRVTFLWVPVYDTRWKGVQRRQARRAARRAAEKAAKVEHTKTYLDEFGGRK